MSGNPVIDWIALTLVPGLGTKSIWQLVNHFGGVEPLFSACSGGRGKVANVREGVLAGLANRKKLQEKAESHLEGIHAFGGAAICPDDELYPAILQEIADAPPVLYLHGRSELLCSKCVAMVGSRAATGYGKRSAFVLARDLAAAGVTVVSGLALGIDSEAHSGALAAGGCTIGVLGCGLDVVYPRQNKGLYEEIRSRGLLVSEYPLGTRPDGYRFPARNRIIAGLSQGVVVVEAARKSGSLITADMALEEGRDIYAVPGQIDSFKSGGTHWLLQQGAKLVQSAEDVLVEFGGARQGEMSGDYGQVSVSPLNVDPEAQALFQKMDVYPVSRNELIAASGLGPAKVTELLLLLELEGAVEILPGDQVRRLV